MIASPSAIPIAPHAQPTPTPCRREPRIVGTLTLPGEFPLHHGGVLHDASLAYEITGPRLSPVICVLGGISAHRRVADSDGAAGWWSRIVGPGLAIDTRRFRVLAFDFLGGNGDSTGPRDVADFPTIDTRDQARALAHLLDHLKVPRLAAFVGASYGGMVALAFAELFPRRAERIACISAAHRPDPRATAWRVVQRRILALGERGGLVDEGLATARALAMITYRSAEEFAARFPAGEGGCNGFPVEAYLDSRGREFATRFDHRAFRLLSESIDLHAVDPAKVTTPTTLVAVRSDQLVPVDLLRHLATSLAAPTQLVEIDSLYGHDAFLKEVPTIDQILRDALKGIGQ